MPPNTDMIRSWASLSGSIAPADLGNPQQDRSLVSRRWNSVTYVVCLDAAELRRIDTRLEIELRLTKALPASIQPVSAAPQLALVCARSNGNAAGAAAYSLAWLGMVMRRNTVGAVDKSITIDPLRRCPPDVVLDGPRGVLSVLPGEHRESLRQALEANNVSTISPQTRDAVVNAIGAKHRPLRELLTWLLAMAAPSPLESGRVEDRSWQEQQDSVGTLFRIADFPLSAVAAWRRPDDRHAPYLAGLIPEPVEHSFIDHDARTAGLPRELFESEPTTGNGFRVDIHQFYDEHGRWLEVANVNATKVEARLGTDLIYYHVPTHSFVLIQFKRLSPDSKSLYVDQRLLDQMDRLDAVSQLSQAPRGPADWRLCYEPCFLKLAYWPDDRPNDPRLPAPGMYLPVSYARMLMADDCTLGPNNGRILGYDQIQRYLITSQFTPLVQNGLAGTVGTSVQQLRALVMERTKQGYSVVAGVEHSAESQRQRQSRTRSRGSRKGNGRGRGSSASKAR